jgi:PHD/YefM family antitoxin component YafN of YafNO toxin-antitoxin module
VTGIIMGLEPSLFASPKPGKPIALAYIRSLSEFQRNARDHIRRLKKTGKPAVLTINCQAEVVVQSAAAYQKFLDDQELLQRLRGISRGLEQAKRGEGRPMREFLQQIASEHRISLK